MTSVAASSFRSAIIPAQHNIAVGTMELAPWRKILAVEPDIEVLHAKSLLLTHSNYCVTAASGDGDLFSLQGTQGFALAMLSDRLGSRGLGKVAQIVRRSWPHTRILIVGEVPGMLEDYLYDEQIDRSADPRQVLAVLEGLYEGMWNRRSNRLDWDATRSVRCSNRPRIAESDPTKAVLPVTTDKKPGGTPSDLRIPVTRAN